MSDDYQTYLSDLLHEIDEYLGITVHKPILLEGDSAPQEVIRERRIAAEFFDGIEESGRPDVSQNGIITFEEGYQKYNGRLLILGEPGAGKTTSLMDFARKAVEERRISPAAPLPVLIRISSWDTKTHLADWLTNQLPDFLRGDFKEKLRTGKILLILDALDELGGERPVDPKKPDDEKFDPRKYFIERLQAEIPAENRVVISCRVREYHDIGEKLALYGALTLRPLNPHQIEAFLVDQDELYDLIQKDPTLRELLTNPLLLSFFSFAYQEMDESDRERVAKLDQAGDLRDFIFMKYIEGRYNHEARRRQIPLPFTLDEVKEILGRAAYEDASGWGTSNSLYQSDFGRVGGAGLDAFLDLALSLNLLARDKDESYRFIHLMLRDALALSRAVRNLRDPNKDVRRGAAEALGMIGDPAAVEPLIEALRDLEWIVGRSSTWALGKISDSRAVEPLIMALSNSDEAVRISAASALEKIGEPAVEPLIEALRDPERLVRSSAAKALGQISDIRAVEPLIDTLRNPEWIVRRSAARALGKIGDPHAVEPLIDLLRDPQWDVHSSATVALGQIGKPAVEPLIAALRDPNKDVRLHAAEALGQIGKPAVEPLTAALLNRAKRVRSSAAEALGEIGDPRAVEPLIAALRDTDEAVRSSAAEALGEIGDPRAVKPLIDALRDPALRDPMWYIRRSAAWTLEDAVPIIPLSEVPRDPNEDIPNNAAWALKKIGEPAVEPLIKALRDPDEAIRYSAAEVLVKIGKLTVEPLIETLRNPEWTVRSIAAVTLREIGTPEAWVAFEEWYKRELGS